MTILKEKIDFYICWKLIVTFLSHRKCKNVKIYLSNWSLTFDYSLILNLFSDIKLNL